jgi:hypothetical protein
MLKWFANHSDEPFVLVALSVTALLPLMALIAVIAAVAVRRERPELAIGLSAVAVISFVAALGWMYLFAPWTGPVIELAAAPR